MHTQIYILKYTCSNIHTQIHIFPPPLESHTYNISQTKPKPHYVSSYTTIHLKPIKIQTSFPNPCNPKNPSVHAFTLTYLHCATINTKSPLPSKTLKKLQKTSLNKYYPFLFVPLLSLRNTISSCINFTYRFAIPSRLVLTSLHIPAVSPLSPLSFCPVSYPTMYYTHLYNFASNINMKKRDTKILSRIVFLSTLIYNNNNPSFVCCLRNLPSCTTYIYFTFIITVTAPPRQTATTTPYPMAS